jgi:hypothetical protein
MTPWLLSRELLQGLGQDLDLPAPWRAQAARAHAHVEQLALLGQVARRLLVCTPAARARLRAWLDRQRAAPTAPLPPWLLRQWIHARVLFFGDDSMLAPVVTALELVPECVRAAAVRECVFVAVGADNRGWTSSSRLVDRGDASRPRLIVLSGARGPHAEALTQTTVHELAHAWLSPCPTAAISTQGEAGLRALAAQEGWLPRVDAHMAREERLAHGCMWSWLGAAGAR